MAQKFAEQACEVFGRFLSHMVVALELSEPHVLRPRVSDVLDLRVEVGIASLLASTTSVRQVNFLPTARSSSSWAQSIAIPAP